MLIQLNNVTKNFVVNEIFSNVKLEINDLEEKEWSTVKAIVKNKLQKYIFKKTKRDPMILPIIVEV